MMSRTTSVTRMLGAAALALGAVGLTGGSASAVSSPIPYSCTWTVGEAQGAGSATATWDSGIPDGFTTAGYVQFSLDPYTGTVVLPDVVAEELRAHGVTALGGTGYQEIWWNLVGTPIPVVLRFPATSVPETGPMTITLTGDELGTTSLPELEVYDLVAGDELSLSSDDGTAQVSCRISQGAADRVIDAVTVVLATSTSAAPTTTDTEGSTGTTNPSATTSPVRPALVQTDQPQREWSTLPLLAAGLGALALVGGAAAAVRAAHVRGRRH